MANRILIGDLTYTIMMTGLFDERRLPGMMGAKGFQAFFGNPLSGSMTYYIFNRETFEIEIMRAGKTIAALVPRGGINATLIKSKLYEGGESSRFNRAFPLSHQEDVISAGQLLKRLAGEPDYTTDDEAFTRQFRMNRLASQTHEDQIRDAFRLHELLASLSVLEGKMPAILGTSDPDQIYDFQRDPDNNIPVSTAWNSGGDIFGTFDLLCDGVKYRGKGMPKMAIMGNDAWVEYLANDEVQKYHDNRGYDLAKVSESEPIPAMFSRFVGVGGFEPRGTLITPKGRKLFLFSYDEDYEDENGDTQLYMPPDQLIVADPTLIAHRYFGPGQKLWDTRVDQMWMEDRFGFGPMNLPMPDNIPNGDIFDPRMFHFYAYEQDKEYTTLVTQSGPIFSTTQTDAIAVASGLIDP